MNKLFDALDAALDAFEITVAPVAPDVDGATAVSEVAPLKSTENCHFSTGATVGDTDIAAGRALLDPPNGATRSHQFSGVALDVALVKPAENRHSSTGATRATENQHTQLSDARKKEKNANALSARAPARVRSLLLSVAPVAPVEQRQKSACFTGATQNGPVAPSGTTAVSCGFEAFPDPSKMFHGPVDSYKTDNVPTDFRQLSVRLQTLFANDDPALHALVERLAKAKAADSPVGDDLPAWQAWMNDRYAYRRRRYADRRRRFSRTEALRIVWREAEWEWHKRHDPPPDPDRCAGCGKRLAAGTGERQIDGAVVHGGDCRAIYDAQYRSAASVALMAMGLTRPWL